MRLFLATPEDLGDQRELISSLIADISREDPIEVVDWGAHVAAQSGGEPTALVPVSPGDVFLGLAWLKFGSPTVHDHEPTEAHAFRPATEQDFELAFRSFATAPRTASLFYRYKGMPQSLSQINGEQLARVDRFYGRFQEGKSPGHYSEYQNRDELIERLTHDLVETFRSLREAEVPVIAQKARPATDAAQSGAAQLGVAQSGAPAAVQPEYAKKMQPGKAYEVSFLAIEVADFAALAAIHGDDAEGVETLHRSFRQHVLETASGYGGELFSWDDQNGKGLLMFWSRRSFDHAIITGLKIIHSLPVFNVDPQLNPLSSNIEIRTAVHDAVIVFQIPVTEIASVDIDYVIGLRDSYTNPGELCVTKRLLERADERLRGRFKTRGRYEREPIYSCRLPSTEQHALRMSLKEMLPRIHRQAERLTGQLALAASEMDASILESISGGVDEIYGLLDRATDILGTVDKSWSKKFFAELAEIVQGLISEEARVWKALRQGLTTHASAPAVASRLEAVAQTAAARRSKPTVTLAKSAKGLRIWAYGEPETNEPPKVDDELFKKIEALLKADPLDHETALTDLLLNKKLSLIEYLGNPRDDDGYQLLKAKLWESADLLLLDDLYSIRGHQRAGDRKIYDVMVDPPVSDRRFLVVRQLLAEEFRPAESFVRKRFEEAGLECENRDQQVVWRSIVVGHPTIKIRTLAALKMSQFSMWQTIAHPNVPVASLHAIGERVAKAESEDSKKIFFDCSRSRIVTAVETFRTRDELSAITKLILLLLDFPFLVEGSYFERFDDVLEKFLSRAQKLNLEVEYFENLRKRLESAKRDPDAKTASRPPAGITKLPLTLQRRLAAEKHYVSWFVTHPDPRIACETLRNISLSNVERILRAPEINGVVMASLLRKPELFTRSGALMTALNNPKCDLMFANRHIPNMARSRAGLASLEKLSRNPSANPAVRAAASRFLAQKKR